jgi:hypothetical protein
MVKYNLKTSIKLCYMGLLFIESPVNFLNIKNNFPMSLKIKPHLSQYQLKKSIFSSYFGFSILYADYELSMNYKKFSMSSH